jgi:hypothetical protein
VIPTAFGDLHRCHLGQNGRPTILFLLHQVDSEINASPMRSLAGSRSGSAGSYCLRAQCLAGFSPGACCASPRWSWCVCTLVEAPRCGAPGGAR